MSVTLGFWRVVAIGMVMFTGLAAAKLAQAQPQRSERTETRPPRELAGKLAATLKDWKVLSCDDRPSIEADGFRGYRIVLRRTWTHYLDPPQQLISARPLRTEQRHEDWELVLIPTQPKAAPADLKHRIPWQPSDSPHHTRDLCLGHGWGYVWFTRGGLLWQETLREKMQLTGGDDRIQLAIDSLFIENSGATTTDTCQQNVAKFGDTSIPYIEQTIPLVWKRQKNQLWHIIGCLSLIDTGRATDLLLRLYASKDIDIRSAASSALGKPPYREAAKAAYFDMLRQGHNEKDVAEACVHFRWTEAIPMLRQQIAEGRDLDVIPVCRELEGRPIDGELKDAWELLRRRNRVDPPADWEKQVAAARQLLTETKDAEGANLYALKLATAVTKGGPSPALNQVGIEILRARPRKSTVAFLETAIHGASGFWKTRYQKVLDAVEGEEVNAAPQE